MPNLLLNRYRSHGPPCRDVFGALYEATDAQSNEPVWVKHLRGRLRPGFDVQELIRRLQALESKALPAPILAAPAEEGGLMVVLPRVPGRRFAEIIQEYHAGRAWGRHHLLRIIAAVCEPLAALHQKGLFHGGINPESILVRDGAAGAITLLPFSVFQSLQTQEYLSGNPEGLTYLPQEQLRGEGDSKSDVYSAGMLLYQCLGSLPPFEEEDPFAIAEAIIQGNYRPFEVQPAVNDAVCGEMIVSDLAQLRDIASKALQRDPGARYPDIRAMQSALRLIGDRFDPYRTAIRLFLAENYDASIRLLEQTLQERQNMESANLLLGRIYGLKKGDYDRGIIYFKRAQLANPGAFSPHEEQAQLHARNHHPSLAVTEYETALQKAMRQHAHHALQYLRLGLADVLVSRNEPGDPVRALEELEQTLKQNPWLVTAHARRARIYRNQGQIARAIDECFTARDKRVQMPTIPPKQMAEIYDLLGSLFYQRGEVDRALSYYSRAVTEDASRADTHNTLAGIYRSRGDTDQALFHWSRSISLKPDQSSVLAAITQLLKEKKTSQWKG